MQLNLATRQSAAYFAFNLCMPGLFIKCKRAVDRISPEDLLRLYLVDSQRISIYSKMSDGGFFTIPNNRLWNLRTELWTALYVSSSRGERDGYFSFNPVDDPLLEVFLLLLRDGPERWLRICAWSGLHPEMALCRFLFCVPPCIITLNCLSVVAVCRGVNAPCCVSACLPCWPVCQDQVTSPFSFFLTRRWTLDFRNVSDVLSAGCG